MCQQDDEKITDLPPIITVGESWSKAELIYFFVNDPQPILGPCFLEGFAFSLKSLSMEDVQFIVAIKDEV